MAENAAIARVFTEMADVCEIRGDNPYKIRALRRAASAIESLPFDVCAAAGARSRLLQIEGIGPSLADKIEEICATGGLAEHRRLLAEFPPALLEVLELPGVGPKTVRRLRLELGIGSVADLAEVARAGRLRSLPRFGPAAEQKLLQAIERQASRGSRRLLFEAEPAARRLAEMLRALPGVQRVEIAGSLRRRCATVGDLDLVVAATQPDTLLERFSRAGQVVERGATRSIRLASGLEVDLHLVELAGFGAALHHFTGSIAHVAALHALTTRDALEAAENEEQVFAAAGLPWIPPELRENTGEIEAARAGRLPRLVELSDIRGDLHVHTIASDGRATIEEMAQAAATRGLGYIAITDHSRALAMARGLDEAGLARQIAAVAQAQREVDGIRIFSGSEVDILQDGALDLAADALAAADVVIGSIHSYFRLSREEMTARIVRAVRSGSIDVLGHPTGRIVLRRESYDLDFERILEAAADCGVALEASATPDRLDLSDEHCRLAKQAGVKLVISTDAHSPRQLGYMRYGVANARRGWIEADDVLNTREADDFLRLLHEGHRTAGRSA